MTANRSRLDLLSAERSLLTDQLARIRRDRMRVQGALDPDFAEQAVQRENDEVLDRLDDAVSSALSQIQRAMERIEHGYGAICEQCAGDIDLQRLQVIPQATRCLECARAESGPEWRKRTNRVDSA